MPSEGHSNAISTERAQATPALSQAIDLLLAAAPPAPAPTLADIRASLLTPHVFWSPAQREMLYAQDQTALLIELDELIERYGAGACARNFVDHTTI